MSFPTTLQQWLAEQAVPLAVLAFVLLMGLFLLYLSVVSRRASISRRRRGLSEETFVDELTTYGYDPAIARLTYTTLRDRFRIPFPIDPSDDLDRDLGLMPEDLDRLTRSLLEATNRRYSPGTLSAPITTVAHLVRHIQTSPERTKPIRRLHIA